LIIYNFSANHSKSILGYFQG